tara:strand:- start:92 stop:562 length:471 start_codon:yes stop_codon:yes gene_type:complete
MNFISLLPLEITLIIKEYLDQELLIIKYFDLNAKKYFETIESNIDKIVVPFCENNTVFKTKLFVNDFVNCLPKNLQLKMNKYWFSIYSSCYDYLQVSFDLFEKIFLLESRIRNTKNDLYKINLFEYPICYDEEALYSLYKIYKLIDKNLNLKETLK